MEYIDGRAMEETAEDEFLLGTLVRKLHSYSDYKIKSPMDQNKELWERMNNMKVYYSDNELTIRNMRIEDAQKIYDTYLSYGWHPSMETYEKYYSE